MKLSPNFSAGEFACRDGCGFGTRPGDVSEELLRHLEAMRFLADRPLYVVSGARCLAHNAAVGGVPNSAHTRATAADLAVSGGRDRIELILAHLLAIGTQTALINPTFARELYRAILELERGLGVAKGFVHVDVDQELEPRPGAWSY